ncbi:hypothetical protein AR158_C243R [Paramecium bursaria Chlorella virus AR158]|uniref:hypothetical protein n=1 Tax=Paramecium bursaria Chlorella virus AR158 TaxID=380598 RepID=UPI00015AA8A7|nr:hypothetical protein AR158_C243R [Paramecium bursaria Chlorella virus AR158]ABU43788.1 hypothetical protein AR158_C243R [Paramecium bursaria Chlorella virus AR158]
MFQLSFDRVSTVSFVISCASYIHGIFVRTCRNRRIETSDTTEIGSLIFKCGYENYCGKHECYYTIKTHFIR